MTYQEYKVRADKLTEKVDTLSNELKADFPTALTDETIRLSNEYGIRSGEFNKVFQELRNLNSSASDKFKRQRSQERRLERMNKRALNGFN